MMKCVPWWLLGVVLFCFVAAASADLQLSGIKCGQKVCDQHQYCSQFDSLCKGCAEICDEKVHNYDPKKCVKDCQDYLHDVRYVRTGLDAGSGNDPTADIKQLYILVELALSLVSILIVVLLVLLIYKIYKWVLENNITTKNFLSHFKQSGNNNESRDEKTNQMEQQQQHGKKDLRLEMPPSSPGTISDNGPATMTTSISRRPAEDSALDYAYDNRAMTGTPSPHSNGAKSARDRESNF